MKINHNKYFGSIFFSISVIVVMMACSHSNEHETKDCGTIETIKGLGIYFNNFTVEEVKNIQIGLGNELKKGIKWAEVKSVEKLKDTLRNQQYFYLNKSINLKDTVYLKLANGKTHVIHSFKYQLRPHAAMGSVTYSCDFYELYVDQKKQTGGIASIENGK